MHLMTAHRDPLRVAIAGGGVAAGELVLALAALAGDRVEVEVIAPSRRLAFRPGAPAVAFADAGIQEYDLAELVADAGASLRIDSVEAVASEARRLRLASGAVATYDALVLATGVRARSGVAGALTWRDHRDVPLLAGVVDEMAELGSGRLVFGVPAGVTWSLPLYELSLLTAADLTRRGANVEVVAVTPERRALAVFGAVASARVEEELELRGVRLITGVSPASVQRGRLLFSSGEGLAADRVVVLPRLTGRRLAGVPSDWNGFVDTDEQGRVRELEDVYAVGDMTSFPVKQGGLATQQADVVASTLAALAGAGTQPDSAKLVLRSRLLGAACPLFLRTELDAHGDPQGSSEATVSDESPWWPAAKLFGRHLTPWMAGRAVAAPA